MKKVLIASTREGAGKTSLIVGLHSAFEKELGFMKPFGDRLVYRKKKNWDYDCYVIKNLWRLDAEIESEDITLGFNHSKLRYMYTKESIRERLLQMAEISGKGKKALIIEGGKHLAYGTSIHLDALSLARYLEASLVFVISGSDETIMDDAVYLKRYLELNEIPNYGVLLNKVQDPENFREIYLPMIQEIGIPVLGIIPYRELLTYFTVDYLSKKIHAKVIAGESGMTKVIKKIFVGAMSTNRALRSAEFNRPQKLLITSGDRHDMILAALESHSSAVILTHNILPPSNIISRASELDIPLLLVETDTYEAAKLTDRVEPLLTEESQEKIKALTELVESHMDVKAILG